MIQREVTDTENTKWTCVQAYSGLQDKQSEKATELTQENDGKVTVVCTPSGGAQTVRLQLQENWIEQLSDEQLSEQIQNTRK